MDLKEKSKYERLLENKLFAAALFSIAILSGLSIGYKFGYDAIETPTVEKQELQFDENFSSPYHVTK